MYYKMIIRFSFNNRNSVEILTKKVSFNQILSAQYFRLGFNRKKSFIN
jgi:hypothetical protein